ncbi:hypothetical protein Sste5346_010183 [Sporothrix stenoceras]|uniref:Uncharacterized protein n=1 Tax=Sporothrix stenoceras TaxID=5173 RepID=A0ABR3YGM7_9PEZI
MRTLTDGPNGTLGVHLDGSTRAARFPAAVNIAATFDGNLDEHIGEALAKKPQPRALVVFWHPPSVSNAILLVAGISRRIARIHC